MSAKELAEKLDKIHSDFIRLEDDTQYDAHGRPRPNYSMSNWDRLESRLSSLAKLAHRLENPTTEQGGKGEE